jgi:hypothetical protein
MTKLPMNPSPDEPQERPRPAGAIRDGVLAALGGPPALYRVNVVPLWSSHYRVNVLVGTDLTSVEIAHSYFVTADETGRILASVPPLVRLYP